MTDDSQPPPSSQSESREMYGEIAALIASLAKAFALSEPKAAEAIESGAMILDFEDDDSGNRFIAATFAGQTARIYRGAIKHSPQA